MKIAILIGLVLISGLFSGPVSGSSKPVALVVAPPDGTYLGSFRQEMRSILSPRFLIVESLEVPSDLSPYDVVILARYEAANPTSAGYVKAYLTAGGGAVVLFGTPFFFAGGTTDLSSISDWFRGGIYQNSQGIGVLEVDRVKSTSLRHGDIVHSYECECAAISSLGPGTQLVARWTGPSEQALAYAYRPFNGRLYYSAGNTSEETGAELIQAGIRWTAGLGPTDPFYVSENAS